MKNILLVLMLGFVLSLNIHAQDSTKVLSSPIKEQRVYLLPITVLSAALAWDFLAKASDTNDQIDNATKMGLATHKLQNEHTRYLVCGISAIVVGVVNTVFAVYPIEAYTTGNNVGVKIKF